VSKKSILCGEFLTDPARIVAQREIDRAVEQIVTPCGGKGPPKEECLAGLPRAEQEVRLLLQ
jgi:hypothetical protein